MNSSISIVMKNIADLTPYENNPRNNDNAVDAVAESIKEFGFKNPVIIDKDGVIVAGHTRYKAAKKLGIKEIPCVSADDLTDEQVRALRIADNKTAELADWNEDLLSKELHEIIDIDMSRFGFTSEYEELGDGLPDNTYTMNVKIPQYEITGECPTIADMMDTGKTDELIAEIEADGGGDRGGKRVSDSGSPQAHRFQLPEYCGILCARRAGDAKADGEIGTRHYRC